ncbi:Hypothetical predicted protein [Pelobates cultripes]|uniref:Uncharacterized protein n=1 Tax=Pelobates cultripes TaxID=61616 RepID=A0AAD1RDV5_PELCU|nr:Hypothetical predicted protein [Pelobates cultripes]
MIAVLDGVLARRENQDGDVEVSTDLTHIPTLRDMDTDIHLNSTNTDSQSPVRHGDRRQRMSQNGGGVPAMNMERSIVTAKSGWMCRSGAVQQEVRSSHTPHGVCTSTSSCKRVRDVDAQKNAAVTDLVFHAGSGSSRKEESQEQIAVRPGGRLSQRAERPLIRSADRSPTSSEL